MAKRCADCGKYVAAGKDCECLILLTTLQRAVGDDSLSVFQAADALIGDRDFHKANAQDRHLRVLELIAEKKRLRDERNRLTERVVALEAELARRRPSLWARLKHWVQDAP